MSDVVEMLPAQRLMIASRLITRISGPIALGSVTLAFKNEPECEEFLSALVAFRNGKKPVL